jgi:hypothetical protein
MHDAMSAESASQHEVVDVRMPADDAILIERVDLVVTCPRVNKLDVFEPGHPPCKSWANNVVEEFQVDGQIVCGMVKPGRRRSDGKEVPVIWPGIDATTAKGGVSEVGEPNWRMRASMGRDTDAMAATRAAWAPAALITVCAAMDDPSHRKTPAMRPDCMSKRATRSAM